MLSHLQIIKPIKKTHKKQGDLVIQFNDITYSCLNSSLLRKYIFTSMANTL